jgi:hypothetical protein
MNDSSKDLMAHLHRIGGACCDEAVRLWSPMKLLSVLKVLYDNPDTRDTVTPFYRRAGTYISKPGLVVSFPLYITLVNVGELAARLGVPEGDLKKRITGSYAIARNYPHEIWTEEDIDARLWIPLGGYLLS